MVWRGVLRQKPPRRKQQRITPFGRDIAVAAASGEEGGECMNYSEPSGSRRAPRNDARQSCHTSNNNTGSSSVISGVTRSEKRGDEVASGPEEGFAAHSPPPSYESYHRTIGTEAGMPLSERRRGEAASSATRTAERGAAHGSVVLSPLPSNESLHGAETSNRVVADLARSEKMSGAEASEEKTTSEEGHVAHHESEMRLLSPPPPYYVHRDGLHKTEEGIFLTI